MTIISIEKYNELVKKYEQVVTNKTGLITEIMLCHPNTKLYELIEVAKMSPHELKTCWVLYANVKNKEFKINKKDVISIILSLNIDQ